MRTLPLYKDPRIAVLRAQPRDVHPGCKSCALHATATHVCMQAVGEPGGLLVILDYPGATEDVRGEPAIGDSGTWLKKQLQHYWDGPVAIDNALKCWRGKSKKLPNNAIDKCRGYLLQTILEVKPQRILCMGGTAMASLFGESLEVLSMRNSVAWITDERLPRAPIFMMPNPVNALRNRFMRWYLEEHIKWSLTVPIEDLPQHPTEGVCHVVETAEDAHVAKEACDGPGGFTYDVENVGRVGNDFLQLVSVSCTPYDTDDAYVWSREALEDKDARQILADMLADKWLMKSGSYLKHDHEVSAQVLGITVRGTDKDVRLQRKCIDAHASGRLEAMGYLVGMGGHKMEMEDAISKACASIQKERKKKHKAAGFLPGTVDEIWAEAVASAMEPRTFAYGLVNRDLLYRYNALDTIVSERCRRRFSGEMRQIKPVQHVWDSIVQETVEAVSQVEAWGVPVDHAALETFRLYTNQRVREVSKHFDQYGVEPSSPKQMANLLYHRLNLPCAKEDEDGAESTDEEALKAIESKHPIVGKLLEFREIDKLRGTYADGMPSYIRDDGRIHPSIDVAGAATGRTSAKDPNLQNLPRTRDEIAAMARRVFAVADGRRLVILDYAQLEYRVAALLSGDPKMKDLFHRGVDVHRGTAQLIAKDFFGVDPQDVTAEMRDVAKTVNFGVLYGMQVFTLAQKLKMTEEKAQKVINAIMGEFDVLRDFIDSSIDETAKTGYTWTWWAGQRARRRWLYRIADAKTDNRKERRASRRARNGAINTPVQGTASDFCIRSLIDLVNWIHDDAVDAKLILPIHDALMFDVAEDSVDEVCIMARDVMLSHDSQDVPMDVDIKVGQNWSDLEKYKVAA